ncbi:hypothetical protein CTAYLR_006620 [Chrysophaeum taylorii]|uniref:GST N-terminal domain-containing protein n=1 Tax=Chrysophaeum taylorii TaxID=2483200 RepID=A0AAD7UMS1_9STRA|nr:hypothetical protein CTAYLR_006620 [Chrysophaeum taylorii]
MWVHLTRLNGTPACVATNLILGVFVGLSAAHLIPYAYLALWKKKKKQGLALFAKRDKLVLKYFDIPALGEPIRVLLALGELDWDDERVEFEDWPKMKPNTKWGQLPVLTLPSGFELTQTKAICRYLAKLVLVDGAPLYPAEADVAFVVDEFIDAFEDVQRKIFPTMKIADPLEKERARAALFASEGDCTALLEKIDRTSGDDGSMIPFRTTLADVWCFFFFKLLKCGFLEGIPVKALDRHTNLSKVERRIGDMPQVKAYYRRQAAISAESNDGPNFYATFAH